MDMARKGFGYPKTLSMNRLIKFLVSTTIHDILTWKGGMNIFLNFEAGIQYKISLICPFLRNIFPAVPVSEFP